MSFLDLTGVQMEKKFSPMPQGEYDLACVEAKLKDTKNGDGRRIAAKFKVVGGDYDGKFIFEGWNIENKNPVAVNIAKQGILKFLTSAGLPQAKMVLESPTELEGLVARAFVTIKEDKNEIKYWVLPVNADGDKMEKPSSSSSYAKELGF